MSELSHTLTRPWTGKSAELIGTQINLIDNTSPHDEPDERAQNTATDIVTLTPATTRSQRYGPTRLREELARRKYAKYQESRYAERDRERASRQTTRIPLTTSSSQAVDPDLAATASASNTPDHLETNPTKDSRRWRGQKKVSNLLHRSRHHDTDTGDTHVDELYENQRGSFVFGIPLYSSNSLLNFDPPAWVDGSFRRSHVDVTNAQLPDPGWEWSWRTWYVDMSGDVDEQGWQYSFSFHERFPWHGTHPWFYSFVRRRRWLRKRVRKHHHAPGGAVLGGSDMKAAHKLNADYFTIHAKRDRDRSPSSESGASASRASSRPADARADETDGPVDDVATMIRRLKAAPVDRDKINIVMEYLDRDPNDRYALADEVSTTPAPPSPSHWTS